MDVIRGLLFRHQQCEAIMPGERRSTCAVIVAGCRLSAATQRDDERTSARKIFRHEGEHAQRAGIRTEFRGLPERADPSQ
jgi:hypothetical protein